MGFTDRLVGILGRHEELEASLARQDLDPAERTRLSQEYAQLLPLVDEIRRLRTLQQEKQDAQELMKDPDSEVQNLACEDLERVSEALEMSERAVKILLLPQDNADAKGAILEIRAGTGGEEAALFAADLLRMYRRYADCKGWSVELMGVHETGRGGIKEASLSISGKDVFSWLKFEAGVHRVQRVPETEASGRIHTSAATVAVLPEVEDIDIHIDEKDLRIDVFRSSGPGGQSVNTTDSAVRVTHIPTGIVVQQQDEKSQHKNKAKALKVLRARLYEQQREEEQQKRSASRSSQVGSGDRSERIRTYNFPQGRVTDHRIHLTLHKLTQVLEGEALDELTTALRVHDQSERLAHEVETLS